MKKVALSTLGSLVKSGDTLGKQFTVPIGTGNWIRIASRKRNRVEGFSAVISLFNEYNQTPNNAVIIAVSGIYTSPFMTVTKLTSQVATEITKLRLVEVSSTEAYLEFYNVQKFNKIYGVADNIINLDFITPILGSIPVGATAVEIVL